MWRKIFNITIDVKLNRISASEGADRILSLMGGKETGVLSTSTTKDGDLHIVRDSHASDLEATKEVRSNGSLEKRTKAENKCPKCHTSTIITMSDGVYCMNDGCSYYRAFVEGL